MFDVVNVLWIISMVFDPKHKLNLLFTLRKMKFLTFKKNNIMALGKDVGESTLRVPLFHTLSKPVVLRLAFTLICACIFTFSIKQLWYVFSFVVLAA